MICDGVEESGHQNTCDAAVTDNVVQNHHPGTRQSLPRCRMEMRVVEENEYFLAILDCLLGEDWTGLWLVETMISPVGKWCREDGDGH